MDSQLPPSDINNPEDRDGKREACTEPSEHDEFLTRVGQMTRALHESMRGLGFDRVLEKAAQDIPDARDRLDYVARMSEQAAQRVLNATDVAGPLQDHIDAGALVLSKGWQELMDGPFSEEGYRALASQTVQYLCETHSDAIKTKAQLMDIMMAQDFQDLTGQVIKKVATIANNLEQQLVKLLIDYATPEVRRDVGSALLNGPQIHPVNANDVVANQEQVDDLLDSLGF